MKNKRVVILIASIAMLLVILCIGIFLTHKSDENEINATGAFNDIRFGYENYEVSITSKEVGHPSYPFDF